MFFSVMLSRNIDPGASCALGADTELRSRSGPRFVAPSAVAATTMNTVAAREGAVRPSSLTRERDIVLPWSTIGIVREPPASHIRHEAAFVHAIRGWSALIGDRRKQP
jgi:hypothetical protein